MRGDANERRRALVITADQVDTLSRVGLLPSTNYPAETPLFRIAIEPAEKTGPATRSCAVLDRLATAPRAKICKVTERKYGTTTLAIKRALAAFLGNA